MGAAQLAQLAQLGVLSCENPAERAGAALPRAGGCVVASWVGGGAGELVLNDMLGDDAAVV